jgi:hypothetical protein
VIGSPYLANAILNVKFRNLLNQPYPKDPTIGLNMIGYQNVEASLSDQKVLAGYARVNLDQAAELRIMAYALFILSCNKKCTIIFS